MHCKGTPHTHAHTGNGNAVLFADDSRVTTFSMHCEGNYFSQKQHRQKFFFSFSMHCEGIFFSQKQHRQKLVCRVILVYETYL